MSYATDAAIARLAAAIESLTVEVRALRQGSPPAATGVGFETFSKPDLLTVEEAAELTRLAAPTVRYLKHKGEFAPHVKLGRRVMFRRADVLAWIESREGA